MASGQKEYDINAIDKYIGGSDVLTVKGGELDPVLDLVDYVHLCPVADGYRVLCCLGLEKEDLPVAGSVLKTEAGKVTRHRVAAEAYDARYIAAVSTVLSRELKSDEVIDLGAVTLPTYFDEKSATLIGSTLTAALTASSTIRAAVAADAKTKHDEKDYACIKPVTALASLDARTKEQSQLLKASKPRTHLDSIFDRARDFEGDTARQIRQNAHDFARHFLGRAPDLRRTLDLDVRVNNFG